MNTWLCISMNHKFSLQIYMHMVLSAEKKVSCILEYKATSSGPMYILVHIYSMNLL